MADIQFIKNDPEQILADTVSEYQRLAGAKLNPADAEMILIDCMAYREVILRGSMEETMRQNFVQYATGVNLDNWGALWGINREKGETDDEYRVRILAVAKGTIGTKAAYFARIMAVPGVSDILIIQKVDDNTLPPGVIKLIPLMRQTSERMIEHGAVHDEDLKRRIMESITTADFGIIGPVFIFQEAVPVAVNGVIDVRGVLGFSVELLRQNIALKVEEYFGELSKKFDSSFGEFDLERKVLEAEGVLKVTRISFPNVPTIGTGEFYTEGEILINF